MGDTACVGNHTPAAPVPFPPANANNGVETSFAATPQEIPMDAVENVAADSADAPHVLSFYRRKCLELATEVQKRDTEVVQLRRALKEARNADDAFDSPSFPHHI